MQCHPPGWAKTAILGNSPRDTGVRLGVRRPSSQHPARGVFGRLQFPTFVVVILAACVTGLTGDVSHGSDPAADGRNGSDRIDELVLARLEALGIEPSGLCSDAVFLRRAYLDVIGTLPTPREVRDFLRDRDPNKRSALIDHLLQRDEFADYWAMKWCDVLRVKSEFPSNLWPNAVQAYHRWVRSALAENMPYDRFARELLTASGSNFRVPQVNFYRAMSPKEPLKIAEVAALTFMGVRIKDWPEDRRRGLAALFAKVGYKSTAEWKEEIVYFDPEAEWLDPATGQPQRPVLPDGTAPMIPADRDPRGAFADWLIDPENPTFARCAVNRIWYWLLGRGIIHEPDDIRPDNPPQNPELLDFLAAELIARDYDLKHIYRLILNSKTYQRSSQITPGNAADEVNFSRYTIRQLDAEVLIDAICQITETTESYSSRIPEPFTFIPESMRSIALADGSITSPFLEKFGRPPRDTGYASERKNTPSASQQLHLLNSTHILKKIYFGPGLRKLLRWARGDEERTIRVLYAAILSRLPTAPERRTAKDYLHTEGLKPGEAALDLAWALMNTKEFIFRH